MSDKLDLYDFKWPCSKMSIQKSFFACKFNITIAASRTLGMDAKLQYICTLFLGDVLYQF